MKIRYIFLALVSTLVLSSCGGSKQKLVILHTNDTHSHVEPLPSTDKKYPLMSGVINRKEKIDSVRSVEKNVLLVDAGDFVQGTPYFNMFGGRVEAQAMNLMGYDVGTIGNHEFDNGLDSMKMILEQFNYPIVNCNYDFSETVLKGMVKPFTTLYKGDIKVGILGVGVDPEGLIQKDKYEGMHFNPIIESANKYAKILKEDEKCDVIVCLSHIGITDDIKMAQGSRNIDVIISGHSHTFMDEPAIEKNLDKKDVIVLQTGKYGPYLGKIELELEK